MRRRGNIRIIVEPNEDFKVDKEHLLDFKRKVEKAAMYDPCKNPVYIEFKKKMAEVKKS